MNKNQERTLAQRCGATVIGFSQANNYCRGYVAWWLRRRIKLAVEKKPSNFFLAPRFELMPPRKDFDGSRYMLADEDKSKPEALAIAFSKDLPLMHQYIATGAGPNKRDKPDRKALTTVPRPALTVEPTLNGGKRLEDVIRTVLRDRCVMYLKVVCKGTLDHAVGLDLINGEPLVYFDPQLGEFTFKTVPDLITWWSKCYYDRASAPATSLDSSAFVLFEDSFEWCCYKLL